MKPLQSKPNIQSGTLSNIVYERILAMIANHELPVGAKLPTEHVLSERMEVSRPVLRQALKQLREDGVVVSRRGSGSYVTRKPESAAMQFAPSGSIADIQKSFEFRAGIESEAAFLAAERRSEKDLKHIQAILEKLDLCINNGELGTDLDEELHEAICKASGNDYFVRARQSIKNNILTGMNLTRNLSLTKPRTRLEIVQAEHYAILDALKRRDKEAARTTMRVHLENARIRVFETSPISTSSS
ncbi:FadR/GntR family transcriptional regulator [Thalassospira australica]|uniref:FadR/GntR family transcriptional regulator n=1 Tax=Thalassospira australica TaxID=1528106 RepID=UPI00068AB0F4|nr:FadR/GntR family transcriptional regulator [Thalassospira australica]